jgi:hypothetical protein
MTRKVRDIMSAAPVCMAAQDERSALSGISAAPPNH